MSKSKSIKSHYEILGLKNDCTEKQVKDAFISLSKENHPDLHPNDPTKQEKFVKINEAYSVLSKPGSRVVYDSNLKFDERMRMNRGKIYQDRGFSVETDAPRYVRFRDESIWSMRDKSKDNYDPNRPYYGIKGIKRLPNYWIAVGAVGIMLLGTLFHYVAFKHGTFSIQKLDTKDERLARRLFVAKQEARRNGNDMQLRLLQDQMEQDEYRFNGGKE